MDVARHSKTLERSARLQDVTAFHLHNRRLPESTLRFKINWSNFPPCWLLFWRCSVWISAGTIDYPDLVLACFYSVLPARHRNSLSYYATTASFRIISKSFTVIVIGNVVKYAIRNYEANKPSETLVAIYQATRRHIIDDINLYKPEALPLEWTCSVAKEEAKEEGGKVRYNIETEGRRNGERRRYHRVCVAVPPLNYSSHAPQAHM
jgi:hypothetical protein